MELDPTAVALLLARAQLALRDQLRGAYRHEHPACAERGRTLRFPARRQDSEPVDAVDDA
jgi:hypothetical protein